MRVVVVGASGGIGSRVAALCTLEGWTVQGVGRQGTWWGGADAVVCCNGSKEHPFEDCFERTRAAFAQISAKVFVALSGGGVGGPPPDDCRFDYIAAKSAVVSMVESYSVNCSDRQYFAVAPGLTATKMTGYKGADPRIPAAFIVKLLSGKYGHLSGSLLAAQRDDLDTMKPMKLRRVECP